MKKLLFILLLIPTFVFASSYEEEVYFELEDEVFADITKTVGDTTTFNFDNKILESTLTNEQLNNILSQENIGQTPNLDYYLTLKVVVNKVDDFSVLKGDYVYIGTNSSWDLESNIKESELASKNSLTNYYYPYGFKIKYRVNKNDEWITAAPNDSNLLGKTLKEKLAYLLNISEDQVIDSYKNFYDFDILNNQSYKMRFDFYNDSNNPITSGSDYLTSSLNKIDTKYVVINYSGSNIQTTFLEMDNKPNILPGITFIFILLSGTYIIKKKNLIDFSSY